MPKRNTNGAATAPAARDVREPITFRISKDVSDRLRNAVFWTPGLTMADLAERGVLRELERVEKEHGGPFPARKAELRGGRPMKK
jgi:hypothetical protein